MEIMSLGYIGVATRRLIDWSGFATGLLGMQLVDRGGGTRAFRMDDRSQRLVVSESDRDSLAYLGFEVADAASLDRMAARLDRHGIAVKRGTSALADERQVTGLVQFADPAGNAIELFHGPGIASDPFQPGRPISGFLTGPLGMGHAVIEVGDIQPLLPFYRDILGFAVSDYGLAPIPLYFFHLNNRHHSFAMVGTGRSGLHHFMVELGSLDDVGQGYDLALREDGRVGFTLGRHTNDYMTSFYVTSPSEFFVEYGWGGRSIDPATWQAHETFDGPSFWGHDRITMPEGPREFFNEMARDAARRGVRAPVQCAWLEQLTQAQA